MKPYDMSEPLLILNTDQKKRFETELKLAMYSQMYKNKFLTAEQLRQLIAMNRKGER